MDWIKFYTRKWLWGSGRDMTAEERGVWADLLAMAGEAKLRDGALRFDVGKPMPRPYIASILRIPLPLLDYCLDIFVKDLNTEDGVPRVKIWEDGTIELTNFARFQAHKERDKDKGRREPLTVEARDALDMATALQFVDRHPEFRELLADPSRRSEAVAKLIELNKEAQKETSNE